MYRHEVYYNLHKHCLSHRACKRGATVAHADSLLLTNVRFVVQPAGRERVLREGKKNVHAYVRGYIQKRNLEGEAPIEDPTHYRRVTYNPFKYDSFVYADTGEPVYQADTVYMFGKNVFVARPI